MKLLVDCTPLHSGGGVQVAIAFLENLRHCNDVTWQAIAPLRMKSVLPKELRSDSRITYASKNGLIDILKIRYHLKRLEKSFSPDVVLTVFGPSYFHADAPHIVGFAIPDMIYDPHSRMSLTLWLKYKLTDAIRITSLNRASCLMVETQTVRLRLNQRAGIDTEKILVIGNSLNPILAKYQPTEMPQGGRFSILIPSTYYPHKNLEIVPYVAEELDRIAPNLDFEFQFTLDEKSAAWRAIYEQANRLGVTTRLMTHGPLNLELLAESYQAASAIFLPTLREASTAVYPESFYFKRPLITSDVDFAHELCGKAALYVPPTDPVAIAAAIKKLSNAPNLANTLVKCGEQQLLKTYPTPAQKFDMQMTTLRKFANKQTGI